MRFIPIAQEPIAAMSADGGGCNEAEGQVPKLALPLVRREFLKGTGILIGTIATGSVLAALAPSPVWVLSSRRSARVMGRH